jgi:hypothetical protein
MCDTKGSTDEMVTAGEPVVDTTKWKIAVDSEYKAKVLRIWSWRRPHHLSFQLNWIQFFISFTSTFAVRFVSFGVSAGRTSYRSERGQLLYG